MKVHPFNKTESPKTYTGKELMKSAPEGVYTNYPTWGLGDEYYAIVLPSYGASKDRKTVVLSLYRGHLVATHKLDLEYTHLPNAKVIFQIEE